MSSTLCARDAIADALHYESLYHTYRLMAVEAMHALRAAKLREESLTEQLAALRIELRPCANRDRQGTTPSSTVKEWHAATSTGD